MDTGFVVLLLALPILALLLWQWWGGYLAAPEERRPHRLALPRLHPALGAAGRLRQYRLGAAARSHPTLGAAERLRRWQRRRCPHRPGSNRRAA